MHEHSAHQKQPGLVSVVVTHYNKDSYLREALVSVITQQIAGFEKLELIVVDDCSDDQSRYADTVQAVRPYAPHTVEILSVLLPRRTGVSWAQNIGYYLSKGEYIFNLDADDVCAPNRIRKQLEFMKRNELDMCGCNYSVFSHQVTNLRPNAAKSWLKFTQQSIKDSYALGNHCLSWGTCGFKASIIDQLSGNNKRALGVEDFEICSRIVSSGFAVGNMEDVLYYYRDNPTQRSKKWLPKA